jgi:hypothetical protein
MIGAKWWRAPDQSRTIRHRSIAGEAISRSLIQRTPSSFRNGAKMVKSVCAECAISVKTASVVSRMACWLLSRRQSGSLRSPPWLPALQEFHRGRRSQLPGGAPDQRPLPVIDHIDPAPSEIRSPRYGHQRIRSRRGPRGRQQRHGRNRRPIANSKIRSRAPRPSAARAPRAATPNVSVGPFHRAIERFGVITSQPVLGGLHHQYCRI